MNPSPFQYGGTLPSLGNPSSFVEGMGPDTSVQAARARVNSTIAELADGVRQSWQRVAARSYRGDTFNSPQVFRSAPDPVQLVDPHIPGVLPRLPGRPVPAWDGEPGAHAPFPQAAG